MKPAKSSTSICSIQLPLMSTKSVSSNCPPTTATKSTKRKIDPEEPSIENLNKKKSKPSEEEFLPLNESDLQPISDDEFDESTILNLFSLVDEVGELEMDNFKEMLERAIG